MTLLNPLKISLDSRFGKLILSKFIKETYIQMKFKWDVLDGYGWSSVTKFVLIENMLKLTK